MPIVDWESVKKSKDDYRERVRSQSFQEKLQTLEKLREREAPLRRLRAKPNVSTSARSTYVLSRDGDFAARPIGNSRLLLLGADATFVTVVVAKGAISVSAAQTFPKPSE
jgi:hypothetical protein